MKNRRKRSLRPLVGKSQALVKKRLPPLLCRRQSPKSSYLSKTTRQSCSAVGLEKNFYARRHFTDRRAVTRKTPRLSDIVTRRRALHPGGSEANLSSPVGRFWTRTAIPRDSEQTRPAFAKNRFSAAKAPGERSGLLPCVASLVDLVLKIDNHLLNHDSFPSFRLEFSCSTLWDHLQPTTF